jgi:hypothetical protein
VKKEYTWSMYVAASIDFLGQTQHFARMRGFFTFDVSKETRDYVAENTVGVVDGIRKSLNDLFQESRKPVEAKLIVSEEDKEEYNKSRQTSPIECRVFSDCILAFVEVGARGYHMNDWMAIRDIFHSIGGSLLMTLAVDASFRAAIELGIGITLEDGDLYGPIRANIHELEERADYPRIIIGGQLFEYMMSFCEGHPRIPYRWPHEAEGSRRFADICRKMIIEDPNDGKFILDYLGSESIMNADPAGEYRERASKYVDKMLHERRFYENDDVLRKFQKVRNYIDSRPHPAHAAE